MAKSGISDAYRTAGVDYSSLDPAKMRAQESARGTSRNLVAKGMTPLEQTRGEPAFVFGAGNSHTAFVVECLGTKSIIAQQLLERHGINRFFELGYDAVAAIVNDIVCVGALPAVVNAYFATGSSGWYDDGARFEALVNGWAAACDAAGATWGGGESPSLSGLVKEGYIELAGAAVGMFPAGAQPLSGERIQEGDAIILLESNGLHANGASLARKFAETLPEGLATKMPDGQMLGEGLFVKSVIYAPALQALYAAGLQPRYLSHISGHGFLKLMRSSRSLTYVIDRLPPVPTVLQFLADGLKMTPAEAYTTFNMGAGMAVFIAADDADRAVEAIAAIGIPAIRAGRVAAGPRQVRVEPLDLTLTGNLYEAPTGEAAA